MSKSTKELIILVGNIGSGKSTLVKEYVEQGYVVIARDSFRYGIGAGKYIFNLKYEPVIWATELTLFKGLAVIGAEKIIIDEVGISKAMRARYINHALACGYKITAIIMPILSKKESVDRRLQDPHGQPDRTIWEGVWEKFNKLYESPTKEEGFDTIINL